MGQLPEDELEKLRKIAHTLHLPNADRTLFTAW